MDWTHINTLLSIIHAAAEAGPKFSKIGAAATDELMAYFDAPPAEETTDDE
jgi:hypothetical protein